MSNETPVEETTVEATTTPSEALPSAYLVSGDSHSPVAIAYLRDALRAAHVPVIEIHPSVDTILPNPGMGNNPIILTSPYVSPHIKERYERLGVPTMELSLSTSAVNNLRLVHGLEAVPSVTLGGGGVFP